MGLSFWEYMRLGRPQWRGQSGLAQRLVWYLLGTPDMHTRIRNAHVCNLVERVNLPPQAQVLDTGCGRAVAMFYLAGKHPDWQFTGLELDDEMVIPDQRAADAGHWRNLKFIQTTVNDLEAEGLYDLVLCMDILEHVPDDVGLLRRIRRALKPAGYLIVHVPRRRFDQWRLWPGFARHDVKEAFGHVRDEYLEEEIRQRVGEAGFTICEFHQTFGKWGEVSFELNKILWEVRPVRRALAILTYPLAMPLGYPDTLRYPQRGNSFLILAQPA